MTIAMRANARGPSGRPRPRLGAEPGGTPSRGFAAVGPTDPAGREGLREGSSTGRVFT